MKQSVASRAEWLARLSGAIKEAQAVAWSLRTHEAVSLEARQLYDRLEVARQQLELLQGVARRERSPADSEWLGRLGWRSPLLDPAD